MKVPFDETDAPPGYRAVKSPPGGRSCRKCALKDKNTDRCVNPFRRLDGPEYDPANPKRFRCVPIARRDGARAHFLPKIYGNEEED